MSLLLAATCWGRQAVDLGDPERLRGMASLFFTTKTSPCTCTIVTYREQEGHDTAHWAGLSSWPCRSLSINQSAEPKRFAVSATASLQPSFHMLIARLIL